MKSLSRFQLFATPWTVAYQVPPSMEFSRQEYWSGLPFPSPGDLPDPGIEPRSPALQAEALLSEPPGEDRWVYIFTHKYMSYPLIFEGDLVDKILILAFFFGDFLKSFIGMWLLFNAVLVSNV